MARRRQSTSIVAAESPSREQVLSARPFVPDHVVYRDFVKETVVLNLETGRYHGLNPSGGKMLQTLESAETVAAAAAELSSLYGRPPRDLEQDLYDFCVDLRARGLIELEL